MNELDQIDGLDANAAALERTLGDTSAMAASFDATLRSMQGTLGETTRDLGNLQRGFAGGLRRAFDGLIFDGQSLSDTLGGVAKSMIDTGYAAAINPVMKHAGGLLANGINAAVSGVMPFANGAPFSQGRVMPFAKGGVVSSPTTFGMRGAPALWARRGRGYHAFSAGCGWAFRRSWRWRPVGQRYDACHNARRTKLSAQSIPDRGADGAPFGTWTTKSVRNQNDGISRHSLSRKPELWRHRRTGATH